MNGNGAAGDRRFVIGLASAAGVIFIWSGFLVFSRAGAVSALTPYDISALRFMVAGAMVLPFFVKWWPRHLPVWSQALLAFSGPATAYSLLMYTGLGEASSAYGGVFANGSMPLFTALVAYLVARTRLTMLQTVAVVMIVAGGILLAYRGLAAGGDNVIFAIFLFLAASGLLSVYIFALKHWQVTPTQALALVNLPNAVIYLPVWLAFLPSGMAEASWSMILFQALFQGLGPGFLAVILYTNAAVYLGPTPTAAFSAVIPATAAILAMPVLGEYPTALEWLGIVVVSVGLALMFVKLGK